MNMRINGGYFVLRREIFDYLHPGDDLVTDTFVRAARAEKFQVVRFDGFWAPMDTLKERAAWRRCIEVETALGHCGSRQQVANSRLPACADLAGPTIRSMLLIGRRITDLFRCMSGCNAASEPSDWAAEHRVPGGPP
jgi:hypothetical protein